MRQEVLFRDGPLHGTIQIHDDYPQPITADVGGARHTYVRDNPDAWGPAPARDYPIYDYAGVAEAEAS
jgi:hypothetical protein